MSAAPLSPPPDGDAHRILLLTAAGDWAPLAVVCLPGVEPLIRLQTRASADASLPTEWQKTSAAARRYGGGSGGSSSGGSANARRIAHGLLGGPWRVDICPAGASLVTSPFDAITMLRAAGFADLPLPGASDPHWRTTAVLTVPACAVVASGGGGSTQASARGPPWLFSATAATAVGGHVTALVLTSQVADSAAPLCALIGAVIEHATEAGVREARGSTWSTCSTEHVVFYLHLLQRSARVSVSNAVSMRTSASLQLGGSCSVGGGSSPRLPPQARERGESGLSAAPLLQLPPRPRLPQTLGRHPSEDGDSEPSLSAAPTPVAGTGTAAPPAASAASPVRALGPAAPPPAAAATAAARARANSVLLHPSFTSAAAAAASASAAAALPSLRGCLTHRVRAALQRLRARPEEALCDPAATWRLLVRAAAEYERAQAAAAGGQVTGEWADENAAAGLLQRQRNGAAAVAAAAAAAAAAGGVRRRAESGGGETAAAGARGGGAGPQQLHGLPPRAGGGGGGGASRPGAGDPLLAVVRRGSWRAVAARYLTVLCDRYW